MRPFLTVAMAALILAACVNIEIVPTDFPYEAMLSARDLGPEWYTEYWRFPRIDGALSSHTLTFRYRDVSDAMQPAVTHRLTIYPDAASGAAGYSDELDFYNLDRPSDPVIDFRPLTVEDLVDSHCERVRMNDQPRISCVWIQGHRTKVALVNGLLDERALTFDGFVHLLEVLDGRLNKLDRDRPRTFFNPHGADP
ncbi:MAG TPA: hypothetical protein VJK02_18155 [Anaerolineales bacterium]|nr:hypothetical protein [Anaerolineales bacterium]